MSATSFSKFATLWKPLIDARLQAVFTQEIAACGRHETSYCELLIELQTLVGRGGKRLRPLLAMLAYEAYGGQRPSDMLEVAVSLELLHTFLLIHDDIIDRDCQRWGGPNIIGVYFERFSKQLPSREALHQAEAWALLAGDCCLSLATQLLLSCGLPTKTKLALSQRLQQVVRQVISGELSDCANVTAKPTAAAIIATYTRKTASYSFELPLITGALATAVPDSEIPKLTELAANLGIAYQLQDDILGMFGNKARTGKSALSDLREGKRTLLVVVALEQAKPAQRQALEALLGQADAGPGELLQAQTIISDSGALASSQSLSDKYLQQAEKVMTQTKMSQPGKVQLISLIRTLTERKN